MPEKLQKSSKRANLQRNCGGPPRATNWYKTCGRQQWWHNLYWEKFRRWHWSPLPSKAWGPRLRAFPIPHRILTVRLELELSHQAWMISWTFPIHMDLPIESNLEWYLYCEHKLLHTGIKTRCFFSALRSSWSCKQSIHIIFTNLILEIMLKLLCRC